MGEGVAPEFGGRLAEQGRPIGLRHRRRGIFVRASALEGIAAGLNLALQIARFAAGPAYFVELIIVGLELVISDAPILHGEIVVGDRLLAVALLVVALGEKVGGQEAPNLTVPVHAAAADAGAEQEGTQMAHRQRVLIDVIADGQRVIRDILKQMMTPHIAQLVLGKSRGEIRGGVAPWPAFQRHDIQAGVAELLAHDGARPTESHQHGIDRFQRRRHGYAFLQPGRPLKPTVGYGTRSP